MTTANSNIRTILAASWTVASILLASASSGQSWVGYGGLAVEVRDGGKPLAGATVRLEFLGMPGVGGPAAASTEADGRAVFGELADGPWLVSVRHPSAMGYDARVELSAGKKPRREAAAQVKVGDATRRLEVRFLVGPRSTSAAAPRDGRAGEAPSRDPREATADSTADRQTAVGELPEYLRTARDGSCPECRPGEWAVTTTGEPRSPGGPGCPDRSKAIAERLVRELGQASVERGPARDPAWSGPLNRETAADLLDLALPDGLGTGSCQILALKLPAKATMGGFQIEVVSAAGAVACPPDAECPGGAGRLDRLPATAEGPGGRVVVAAFRHNGARRDVRPRLTVYFVPAGDWRRGKTGS